jgi:formate C-acetyltransferase
MIATAHLTDPAHLVRRIRDDLAATRDTVCLERTRLATEAWREHEHEPAPLRRARVLQRVLAGMSLDLHSNPFFAGTTSSRPRAWMLVPECGFPGDGQVALEHPELAGFIEGKVPQDLLDFWKGRSFGGHSNYGHLAVDMQRVVHQGLLCQLDRLQDCQGGSQDQNDYRQAMIIAIQAVLAWADRHAEAAEVAAAAEVDPLRRNLLRRVAAACRQVPARPARDLFEALQAMVLVHLAIFIEGHGMSVSIGLIDRVLEPFFNGVDDEMATVLCSAFLLKLSAVSLFGRGSKTQAITVGGGDSTGRDRCSRATRCFIEAFARNRLGDPSLYLRWHPGLDPLVKRRAAGLLAEGLSMPILVNDPPTTAGFDALGLTAQDAYDYCVIGCNELGVPGRSMESALSGAGSINYLGGLTAFLLALPHPVCPRSTQEILDLWEPGLRQHFCQARQAWKTRKKNIVAAVPTPFTSVLMHGCIEGGCDLLMGMPYRLPGYYERGLTDAANALAALEQVVFSDRFCSLAEAVAAMRVDFAGPRPSAIRDRLRSGPKWGTDDPAADRWGLALVAMRERILDELDRELGDRGHAVCHVVRSLHRLDGQRIPASPDGRHAGEPVADSIGACVGTAHQGPTAVLATVLKLDPARTHKGGYNLNLTLPTGTTVDHVMALIEGFFGAGGQELQINRLDPARLRAAQQDPAAHGDLVVRIAGFNARFVDLSPEEQGELIARAEEAADRLVL